MSPCNELIPRSLRQLLQSRYLINPLLKRFSVGKADGGGGEEAHLKGAVPGGYVKLLSDFPLPPSSLILVQTTRVDKIDASFIFLNYYFSLSFFFFDSVVATVIDVQLHLPCLDFFLYLLLDIVPPPLTLRPTIERFVIGVKIFIFTYACKHNVKTKLVRKSFSLEYFRFFFSLIQAIIYHVA